MKSKERKKEPGEIEIDIDDVEIIMGTDFVSFHLILENGFCGYCTNHTTTIENYRIYLNDLEDLILRGQCKKCHGQLARYIETGENKSKAGIAKHIRAIKKQFKASKGL